jgi:hypothetical protein
MNLNSMKTKVPKTAEELDRRFEEGESIFSLGFDKSQGRRINEIKRVNVDMPAAMLRKLDKEAAKIGITRQSLIKVWIANQLKQLEQEIAVARTPSE